MTNFDHYVKASYDLVVSTEVHANLYVEETVEHYLVFLLARHFDKPNFTTDKAVAELIMEAQQETNDDKKHAALKQVGDMCLLISSLTPFFKLRKGIQPKYYVNVGRSAFGSLGSLGYSYSDTYEKVYINFPRMRDLLEVMFGLHKQYTEEHLHMLVECESKTALQQVAGPKVIIGPWSK